MVLPDSDTSLSLYRTQDNSYNTDTRVLSVWAQVCSLCAMVLRLFTEALLNFISPFAVWRYLDHRFCFLFLTVLRVVDLIDLNLWHLGPKPSTLPSWVTSCSISIHALYDAIRVLTSFLWRNGLDRTRTRDPPAWQAGALTNCATRPSVVTNARDARGYTHVCPYLDGQGSRVRDPHGHFCDSEWESHKFRGLAPSKFRCYLQTAVV